MCEIFIFSPLGAPAEILLLRDDEWDTVQPVAECPPLPEFPFFFSLSLSLSVDWHEEEEEEEEKKTQQHVCTGSITLIVTGHRAAATSLTFRHFLSLSRVYILKEEEEKKKKKPWHTCRTGDEPVVFLDVFPSRGPGETPRDLQDLTAASRPQHLVHLSYLPVWDISRYFKARKCWPLKTRSHQQQQQQQHYYFLSLSLPPPNNTRP